MPRLLIFSLGLALACATVLIALSAQTASAKAKSTDQWIADHYKTHPLVGTIWNSRGEPVELTVVEASIARATHVLLGEIHTNPDHHRLQAQLLQSLIAAGRRPAVVFEMIPVNMQPKLDAYMESGPPDGAKLGNMLSWSKRGWPKWDMYRPIAATALSANLNIRAGDVERSRLKSISQGDNLARLVKELGIDITLANNAIAALERSIEASHCNLLPTSALKPMTRVQRARDAHLAKTMLSAKPTEGAVLIAGSGHVRRDWGVAKLIKQNLADARVVAIRFVEVAPDKQRVADYTTQNAGLPAPFDYTYFTPRADLIDHCARMAKHMKTRRAKDR